MHITVSLGPHSTWDGYCYVYPSPSQTAYRTNIARSDSTKHIKDAVLDFITDNPYSDACDIAFALHIPIGQAFAVADALMAEGKIKPG